MDLGYKSRGRIAKCTVVLTETIDIDVPYEDGMSDEDIEQMAVDLVNSGEGESTDSRIELVDFYVGDSE